MVEVVVVEMVGARAARNPTQSSLVVARPTPDRDPFARLASVSQHSSFGFGFGFDFSVGSGAEKVSSACSQFWPRTSVPWSFSSV